MKTMEIKISEVQKDNFFRFASDRDTMSLSYSIKRSGILMPLFVLESDKGFQLLSGFKRLRVALDLKKETLPVVRIKNKKDLSCVFLEIVAEQVLHRSFNLVEKARVLNILDRLFISSGSIYSDFLSLLELPDNPKIINEVETILQLSAAVQTYIETYDLSLKQVSVFHLLTHHQQDLLIEMGNRLQIRGVELVDLIHLFVDVTQKADVTIEQLYCDLKIDFILEQEEWSRNQKIARIKERLMTERFPKIRLWNDRLSAFKKEMGLPKFVRLSWDKNLEVPGIELCFSLRNLNDVKTIGKFLNDDRFQKGCEKMMEIV